MDDTQNRTIAQVQNLMRDQDFRGAIKLLLEAERQQHDARHEKLLVECRYGAGRSGSPLPPGDDWPQEVDDPFENIEGIPEIRSDQLNLTTLSAGIRKHGALIVRGLVGETRAQELADGIETALRARDAWKADPAARSPYYDRLDMPDNEALAAARSWVEMGGVWTADSPRMLIEIVNTFESVGALSVIESYFGERPVLSVSKSTLRRVPHTIDKADWHQDGAFLGTDIRSVNIWVSLSHCGKDASGLEIYPRRIEHILPTGVGGAHFKWSLGPETVAEAVKGVGTESPLFAPGDAMIFDHLFLHRTGLPPGKTKDRYAIESWFFAPSAYPKDTGPLLV